MTKKLCFFILFLYLSGFCNENAHLDSIPADSNKTTKNSSFSTDSVPPSVNFYINSTTIVDFILPFFNAVVFDFLIEFENTHKGSILFNLASLITFDDYAKEDKSWEGYRYEIAPSIGYRFYLGHLHTYSSNSKIKHRNVPLNSVSPFIQVLGTPVFKFANETKYGSKENKTTSFDLGASIASSLGIVWNGDNFLWNPGITFGYQYWSKNARNILTFDNIDSDVKFIYINGTAPKGFYFLLDNRFGF